MSTQTNSAYTAINQDRHASRALLLGSSRISKSAVIIKLALIGALFFMQLTGFSQGKSLFLVNVNAEGVILDGYDPVTFFTENRPVKGNAQFQSRYHNATYYFSSEENKKLFDQHPARYEVQYGGYCAYAVSLGRTAPIDVNTFSIVNDRLVVQHNQKAVNGWNKDVEGNLKLADKYWPEVAKNSGHQIKTEEEAKYVTNVNAEGIILDGYDPVGYFTENKPIKGVADYQTRYHGATYLFASAENKQLFDENPAKYEPQYGGYCAYAVSVGKLRPIDITIFQFVDGRLLFQHTQQAYNLFNKDTEGNTQKADEKWPGLVKKHAGKPVKYDKPAK
jgi:YHS domain-containing protein